MLARPQGWQIAPTWMRIRYGTDVAEWITARTLLPTARVAIFTAPGAGRTGGSSVPNAIALHLPTSFSRRVHLVLVTRSLPGTRMRFVARGFTGGALRGGESARAETVERLTACAR